MYSIEINGKNYPLKFGFDFMRKMNKKMIRRDEGTGKDEENGLEYVIAQIMDHNIEYLVEVIMTANATEDEKIDKKELIEWIENDDTDIDAIFEEIDSFFAKANCTKNAHRNVMLLVEQMAEEKAEEA